MILLRRLKREELEAYATVAAAHDYKVPHIVRASGRVVLEGGCGEI